jgi:hypothetical protein
MKLLSQAAALLALIASSGALAGSPEGPGELALGHGIPRGAQILLTPLGQRHVYEHFQEFLFHLGFAIDAGEFPDWSYGSSLALDLDHLPPQLERHGPTLRQTRDVLRRWARGITLQNPHLRLTLANVSYELKFKRFNLAIQPGAGNSLGAGNLEGLTLTVEAEIPDLQIGVARVRASDEANPVLGVFGLNDLKLRTMKGSRPLSFKLPIHFSVADNGMLRVRADSLVTNLNEVRLEASFRRPLVLPKVELRIDNHSITLNQDALERDLLANQESMVKALLTSIKANAETQFPAMVNAAIESRLNGGFTEVGRVDPVGLDNPQEKDQFKLVASLQDVLMEGENLRASLTTAVEDPRRAKSPPLPADARARAPRLTLSPEQASRSHFALALDTLLINRIIQLSFDRGYYKSFKSGPAPDDEVLLITAPRLSVEPGMAPGHARLSIRVGHKEATDGSILSRVERLAIKGTVLPVDVDMDVCLLPNGAGGAKLVAKRITRAVPDMSAVRVLSSRVVAGVNQRVAALNAGYLKTESVLSDSIAIPTNILGPARISGVGTAPSGHFVFYLEFTK